MCEVALTLQMSQLKLQASGKLPTILEGFIEPQSNTEKSCKAGLWEALLGSRPIIYALKLSPRQTLVALSLQTPFVSESSCASSQEMLLVVT